MTKRIFIVIASLFVRLSDWTRENVGRLFGERPFPTCVVLVYHSVSATERARFAGQMDMLLRKAKPVSAGILSLKSQDARCAAVTFDDGLRNILENALPELEKRSIPVTLFIATEILARQDHSECDVNAINEPKMSAEQLCQLPSDLVTIGSHTMSHVALSAVGRERLRQEVLGSRVKLERILHREVKLLSVPYGAFDENVIEVCREAGYERVFTSLPLRAFLTPAEFVTGRVGVDATDWPIEFRLKLSGAYRWLPYIAPVRDRLRLFFRNLRGFLGKANGVVSGEAD